MSEDDPSKKTESPRRDILKTIGAGAFGLGIGAPMLSNGAAAASQDSSNVVENFSHSEVTGADAENSIQDLTDTEEYSLLEESVKSDGMSVDTSNAVVYRSSYEENQRTVASFPVDGDDELRVVIGKNDNTGDIVIAATERKTRTNNQSEIVLKQPQSIAQQSDSPTVSSGVTEADSLSSSGLVTTTVTVPHGTEQSTISTGTQSTVVTPPSYSMVLGLSHRRRSRLRRRLSSWDCVHLWSRWGSHLGNRCSGLHLNRGIRLSGHFSRWLWPQRR